ncbi:MAG TPA: hydroxymethylbilane synthase [Solirubrobacterales bacterium]|jgi:hydroxymethylbilane synthase|nr:hydroxymethylbilane synthase [Solirubrobacterales bacterium]
MSIAGATAPDGTKRIPGMLRVGTRGSKLALAQTGHVVAALRALDPSLTIETVVINNSDDAGDKSRYVNGIEQQLRSEEIDLGIHSAKDVPGEESPGLLIVAVPPRADPRDMLCGVSSLDQLNEGAIVGTASLRRAAQLRAARRDLQVQTLRGNIDTRLGRLRDGGYAAIILAAAGLERLGVTGVTAAPLDFVPAPGQGCLALQVRSDDLTTTTLVAPLSDAGSQRELMAERAAAIGLSASCNTPIGIRAKATGDQLVVRGWIGLPDGSTWIEDELTGIADDAEALGRSLAARMRAAGADELLTRAEEMAA